MKRTVLIVSGLMMLSSLCQLGRAGPNEAKIYKEASPSVLTIIVKDENHKQLGQGTGFIIVSGVNALNPFEPPGPLNSLSPEFGKKSKALYDITSIIVTNYHVVSADWRDPAVWQKYFYTVITSDGTELPETQNVAYDSASISNVDYDVAFVICHEVPKNSYFVYPRSSFRGFNIHPEVGQSVIVIGSPVDPTLANSITTGIVSGIRQNGDIIQFSAPITGGNSGSPLLDENGVVLGVVGSTLEQAQNINFAVFIQYVKKLLDSYCDQRGRKVDWNTGKITPNSPKGLLVPF
jgi:S1-C subfamily serine protease